MTQARTPTQGIKMSERAMALEDAAQECEKQAREWKTSAYAGFLAASYCAILIRRLLPPAIGRMSRVELVEALQRRIDGCLAHDQASFAESLVKVRDRVSRLSDAEFEAEAEQGAEEGQP